MGRNSRVLIDVDKPRPVKRRWSKTQFAALECALGMKLDAEARARLKQSVNDVLAVAHLDFGTSAEPIFAYYSGAAKRLRELIQFLDAPIGHHNRDLSRYAEDLFDKSRPSKALTPELFRLKQRLRSAASSFDRAAKALAANHAVEGIGAGRKLPPGLVYFVIKMASFAEAVKVTPTAYYSDHRDGDPRETPFVHFVDCLRKILSNELPQSKTKTVSIVRSALPKAPTEKTTKGARRRKANN